MRHDGRCRISQTNSGLEPGPLQASAARRTGRKDGIFNKRGIAVSSFGPASSAPVEACVPFSEQPVLQPHTSATVCRPLVAREGAQFAVADMNRNSAEDTVKRITAEIGRAFDGQTPERVVSTI
jgi:hypothetical protein